MSTAICSSVPALDPRAEVAARSSPTGAIARLALALADVAAEAGLHLTMGGLARGLGEPQVNFHGSSGVALAQSLGLVPTEWYGPAACQRNYEWRAHGVRWCAIESRPEAELEAAARVLA